MRPLAILAGLLLAGGAVSSVAQDAPPAGDDRYRFAAGRGDERAVRLEVSPEGARFTWTASPGWDTALLGVKILSGHEDVVKVPPEGPYVEIGAGGRRLRQHLDVGGHGLRWLNLSGLRAELNNGTPVEIRGHGVLFEADESGASLAAARLRTFANGLDLSRRILIVAPHPDDAEIAAFGLYAGRNATIVTVTSGNAGDANYAAEFPDPAQQYLFKGFLRAVDSVTVPWLGGIPPDRTFNLGYFDARLRTMREKPGETVAEMYGPNTDVAPYRRANIGRLLPSGSRANSWPNLVADLAAILKKVDPQIVVTAHPHLDYHADHRYATAALAEALERWKKPATFLLYTNHADRNLYPYGPAETTVSLPPTALSLPAWGTGAELPVQGVYSHPVGVDLRKRKLYALEAMHDLRLAPGEQAACGDPNAPRRPDYPRVPAVDYFRRGPRPDEIFFVYDRDGFRQVARTFVAGDMPAAAGK
jgi:LmbE family N-acetylglucosaminyl deacetylase